MAGLGTALFVLLMGFAGSGMVYCVHRALTGDSHEFRLSFDSPFQIVWSVLIFMFAGPHFVVTHAFRFWTRNLLPNVIFSFCCLLATFWSFCSGILIVQALYGLGLV